MYKIRIYLAFIAIILGVSACGPSLEEKQATLAQELGVEPTIGAPQGPFPVGYYSVKVWKGTPIEKVHLIIKGYEKAYHCGSHVEVYYFYSINDNDALRMQVGYDDNLKVIKVDGEDDDSRSISIKDCFVGRIGD